MLAKLKRVVLPLMGSTRMLVVQHGFRGRRLVFQGLCGLAGYRELKTIAAQGLSAHLDLNQTGRTGSRIAHLHHHHRAAGSNGRGWALQTSL